MHSDQGAPRDEDCLSTAPACRSFAAPSPERVQGLPSVRSTLFGFRMDAVATHGKIISPDTYFSRLFLIAVPCNKGTRRDGHLLFSSRTGLLRRRYP